MQDPREIKSLDGNWQIIYDTANIGKVKEYQDPQNFSLYDDIENIQVPGCWETFKQDYEGVGWYRRNFEVPKAWADKCVRIHFDAVNYLAEVWLNGEPAGYHEGGYGPFEFEIQDLLDFDRENVLIVRVIGPIVSQDIIIDGFGMNDMPHWRGAIAGGIWQSVHLIVTGKIYMNDVFIHPDIHRNRAVFQFEIQNTAFFRQDINANVSLYAKDKPSNILNNEDVKIEASPGLNTIKLELPVQDVRYWSPENPFLYIATIQLMDEGEAVDAVKTRFGMREFTIKDNNYYLNGERIYLKSAFWEGLYPHTLAYPENESVVRNEIRLAKDAGFNLLRPWRKPPPPPILDLADEMGILMIGNPPVECMYHWPSVTPYLSHRIENEVRSLVLRDRNHPSVVVWELLNEVARSALGRLKHKISMIARDHDPTRIIVDESGGWAGGAHVYLPYSVEPITINEIHSYKPSPVDDATYNAFLLLGQTEVEKMTSGMPSYDHGKSIVTASKLNYVSEIGYGGLPDLAENVAKFEKEGNPLTPTFRYHKSLKQSLQNVLEETGLNQVYRNISEFCLHTQDIQAIGNKLQIEAVRLNPRIAGYCLHALTGGDWVIGAGILDLFRNPKKVYWAIKDVNQAVYLAIRPNPSNVYAEKGMALKISCVNERDSFQGRLIIEIFSVNNLKVFELENAVTVTSGISTIFEERIQTDGFSGCYSISGKLLTENGTAVAANTYEICVFDQKNLKKPSEPLTILDPAGSLKRFLENKEIGYWEFKPAENTEGPVFISEIMPQNSADIKRFEGLDHFIKAGGVAVHLNPRSEETKPLPFDITYRDATGMWFCVSHIIRDHQIFDGLPSQCMMGQTYQNVCAAETITGITGEVIVGSVSWNWWRGKRTGYHGPGDTWWGADLSVVPYGKGKMILSTLKLVENLGLDPVADKIFYNMVRYTTAL